MTQQPLVLRALWSALGVTAYVAVVALLISYADRNFSPVHQGIAAQMAFLLLFVFSALLTGALVLLPPTRMYLDGHKEEGMQLLFYTGGWLAVITVGLLVILAGT